jgi:uncharacterized membrane protein HdeD (DUF308 family)
MLRALVGRYWWVYLVRGILALLFGILALMSPGATIEALIYFFGAWALITGLFMLIGSFGAKKISDHWWVWLLAGFAGIAAGILTFMNPRATGLALLIWLAVWAIVSGVFDIVTAVRWRKELRGEGWLILAGAAWVIFGLLILKNPLAGAMALITLIGIWAIILGFVLILVSFKAKKLATAGA